MFKLAKLLLQLVAAVLLILVTVFAVFMLGVASFAALYS